MISKKKIKQRLLDDLLKGFITNSKRIKSVPDKIAYEFFSQPITLSIFPEIYQIFWFMFQLYLLIKKIKKKQYYKNTKHTHSILK